MISQYTRLLTGGKSSLHIDTYDSSLEMLILGTTVYDITINTFVGTDLLIHYCLHDDGVGDPYVTPYYLIIITCNF